jgi:hypothetical protein
MDEGKKISYERLRMYLLTMRHAWSVGCFSPPSLYLCTYAFSLLAGSERAMHWASWLLVDYVEVL